MATIRANPRFNEEDAQAAATALRSGMEGAGTNEDTLIKYTVNYSNQQRQEIRKCYKTMYGRDLEVDLKSELSHHLGQTLEGLFMTPVEFEATELKRAMKGAGTDEKALVEILCCRSHHEIKKIAETYERMYKSKLEEDLERETGGNFRRLIISLSTGGRDDDNNVDERKAQQDAQKLFDAGEKRWGTDEPTFNMILCSRSVPQLRATFAAYSRIAGHDIEAAIKKETSGDLEDGYLFVVQFVKSRVDFFAIRLYKSMKGAGTDDNTLVRVIVSRSEIDLEDIKQVFHRMYGKSLSQWVSGDCSGDYKKTLLAIIK